MTGDLIGVYITHAMHANPNLAGDGYTTLWVYFSNGRVLVVPHERLRESFDRSVDCASPPRVSDDGRALWLGTGSALTIEALLTLGVLSEPKPPRAPMLVPVTIKNGHVLPPNLENDPKARRWREVREAMQTHAEFWKGARGKEPPIGSAIRIESASWKPGVFPREMRVKLNDGRTLHIGADALGLSGSPPLSIVVRWDSDYVLAGERGFSVPYLASKAYSVTTDNPERTRVMTAVRYEGGPDSRPVLVVMCSDGMKLHVSGLDLHTGKRPHIAHAVVPETGVSELHVVVRLVGEVGWTRYRLCELAGMDGAVWVDPNVLHSEPGVVGKVEYTVDDLRECLKRARTTPDEVVEVAITSLTPQAPSKVWEYPSQPALVERELSCKSCRRVFCTALCTAGAVIVVKCPGCEAEGRAEKP